MELRHGATSDVGLKRSRNEDGYYADSRLGLYVVCDGMGGENAGDVASRLAVEIIPRHVRETLSWDMALIEGHDTTVLPQTNRLASAIRLANRRIRDEAERRADCVGMGTTVASALIQGQILSVAHVGDSRVYHIRGAQIQALTADHSLIMDHIRSGLMTEEQAKNAPYHHVVTRALGAQPEVEVEVSEMPVAAGDRLLLCSDGLTRRIDASDIVRVIMSETEPQPMAERLVAMANLAGGEDNTTVILVVVDAGRRPRLWHGITHRIFHPPLLKEAR